MVRTRHLAVQDDVAVPVAAGIMPQRLPAVSSGDVGAQSGAGLDLRVGDGDSGHAALVLDGDAAAIGSPVGVGPRAVVLVHPLVDAAVAADPVMAGGLEAGAHEARVRADQSADHDMQGDVVHVQPVAPSVVVRTAAP